MTQTQQNIKASRPQYSPPKVIMSNMLQGAYGDGNCYSGSNANGHCQGTGLGAHAKSDSPAITVSGDVAVDQNGDAI